MEINKHYKEYKDKLNVYLPLPIEKVGKLATNGIVEVRSEEELSNPYAEYGMKLTDPDNPELGFELL